MKYLLLSILLLFLGCEFYQAPQSATKRVVSFTPAITETIFALDAQDLLVGISSFCKVPAAYTNLAQVGGLFNPNLELLLVLQPTDIYIQGNIPAVEKFCFSHKIKLHKIVFENYTTITNGVQIIGNALDCSAKAQEIIKKSDLEWHNLAAPSNSFTALISVGRENAPVAACTTITKNSFLAEALSAIGGSNICSDVVGHYPTLSAEVINMRNPSVIFDLQPGRKMSAAKFAQRKKQWLSLPEVDAVKNDRVFIITNEFILTPTLKIIDIAKTLNKYSAAQ